MVSSAQSGLEYVRGIAAEPDVLCFVEVKVDISPWTFPGQFGTSDVILVYVKKRHVIVFDWKYGMEPVYPQENEQALGYVLGSWNTTLWKIFGDPEGITIEVVIEQPRVAGAGGSWKTTMAWVLEWGETVRQRAQLTTDPVAPRTPGHKQCRWCLARRVCADRAAWLLDTMSLEFDDLDSNMGEPPSLPTNLTPERRSVLMEMTPHIRLWLEDLHKSAYHDAEKGRPTPGWKMVDGKHPRRKWRENQVHKVERLLSDEFGGDAYEEPKLLSPPQVQKKLGKDRYEELFGQFVDRGTPHPILVNEHDTRPRKPTVEEMFDDD